MKSASSTRTRLIKAICDPNYGGLQPSDPTYGTLCPNGVSTRLMDQAFVADRLGAGRFGQIYEYSTNNRSFYDGINIQLRKRMSKHIMFQVSDVISWSRAWGGFPVASYGGSGLAVTPQQQFASRTNSTTPTSTSAIASSSAACFNLPWGFSLIADLHRGLSPAL